MSGRWTKMEQIARQLGVSVRVLEQYLQCKNAEIVPEEEPAASRRDVEREWLGRKGGERVRQPG